MGFRAHVREVPDDGPWVWTGRETVVAAAR